MADIYPYLVFENAKEAMAYYAEQFDADIVARRPLTKAQVDSYGLELTDLDETTAVNLRSLGRPSSVLTP